MNPQPGVQPHRSSRSRMRAIRPSILEPSVSPCCAARCAVPSRGGRLPGQAVRDCTVVFGSRCSELRGTSASEVLPPICYWSSVLLDTILMYCLTAIVSRLGRVHRMSFDLNGNLPGSRSRMRAITSGVIPRRSANEAFPNEHWGSSELPHMLFRTL